MHASSQKTLWHLCLFVFAAASPYSLSAAGPDKVDLRSTEPFAILAGAGITTTGGGVIDGDFGASPIAGSAIGVACPQVTGTIYAVDASGPACAVIDATLLTAAKGDLTIAYNDAAGRTPIPSGSNLNPGLTPGAGNIGGMTLAPGLYKFTTTAMISGADVTLMGGPSDVWIFQCAQDLQLASGIKVILAGGARAENIFWQVGTSAVLGTSSSFKGTILADQSVTMETSSTIEGRALAFEAGVVFNGSGASRPAPLVTEPEIVVEQPLGADVLDGGNRDFGSVVVGDNNDLVFTIKNTGTADLTGLGITIDGADASLFTVTANPTAPVAPNGDTTFTISFAPLTVGLKTAALRIASNDATENPFDIALTGTATAVAEPEIVVEQPLGIDVPDGGSRDFGPVVAGDDGSLVFTIKNTGTADLTGLNITIDGVDASLFTVTVSPNAPVGPNGETTFAVRFALLTAGVKTAELHIASNDATENPFDIALTGTTTSVDVAVTSLIALNPQTGLFEQTVQLTNAGPVAISSALVLIQGLPADVYVYNAAGTIGGVPYVQYNYPLPAGASVDLLIEYSRESRTLIPDPIFTAQAADAITLEPTNTLLEVDRVLMLSDGRFLIEFSATPGRSYGVQYSNDMTTWTTILPTITASGDRVQWYDDGPPKTESMPVDVSSRFYRIFELP